MSARRSPPEHDELPQRLGRAAQVLGLTHTLEHLDEHLDWAAKQRPAPAGFLERVLAAEAAYKIERRIERRIECSGLRERKSLEAFDWPFQPDLDKSAVMQLATLDFVRRKEDLVITGKSGTGKSHILQSLALRACQQQIYVRYARCVDLLDDLFAGLADNTYPRRLRRWAAPELLVVDDVGLGQIKKRDDEPTAAHTLFNLIDRRHGKASTVFSSNIKLSAWGRYLGDPTLAVAILDRVSMSAIRLDISGPSYRQHVARERAKQRGDKIPDEDDKRDGGTPADS
jgi:DNA replication protein DnaC